MTHTVDNEESKPLDLGSAARNAEKLEQLLSARPRISSALQGRRVMRQGDPLKSLGRISILQGSRLERPGMSSGDNQTTKRETSVAELSSFRTLLRVTRTTPSRLGSASCKQSKMGMPDVRRPAVEQLCSPRWPLSKQTLQRLSGRAGGCCSGLGAGGARRAGAGRGGAGC